MASELTTSVTTPNAVKSPSFKEPSLKAPTPQGAIENTNTWGTKQLVAMALLCAVGVLLSFVEFPLLPGAAWLKYDASMVPAMLCGFAYGPGAGLAVGVIGAVIHGILFADFTGAVMNILVVVGFVLPAAIVYKRRRTYKFAMVSLVPGIMGAIVMATIGNLVLTPMWLGVPMEVVAGMIIPILIPFNLLKGILNAIFTLALHKSISSLPAFECGAMEKR